MSWVRVRAALIALGVVVHGFAAAPLPRSVKRSQMDTPMAKEELGRWVAVAARVGVEITIPELADWMTSTGAVAASARKAVMAPFGPWFRLTGTGQGWGLFTYPDTFPHRLTVEVREGRSWRTVYAGLDPDATWMRPQLAYRRVRAVYDGNTDKVGPSYEPFVDWVAAHAFADFPDAKQVRVGFVRTHSTMPGEAADPEVAARLLRVRSR
jgi:hypothetical protein